MSKYAIGVDYGTLSARALVVEIGTGKEMCSATMNYPHAVMDEYLPDGTRLKPDWALQHPQDYLDCLKAQTYRPIQVLLVDDGGSFGLNTDSDSGTGQFCSLQRHKAHIGGVQYFDHAGDHSLFLYPVLYVFQDLVQRDPADGGRDLCLKRRADSDHDLFGVCALRRFDRPLI